MLFLLIGALVAVSIMLLLIRKTSRTVWLLGLCSALFIHITGIMIFIAKKGGFPAPIILFFFFSVRIRNQIRDLYLTLGTIGYLVALGRYLFPFMLLELSMDYSAVSAVRNRPWLRYAALSLPAVLLVCYYPAVYRCLTCSGSLARDFLYYFSIIYIIGYLLTAWMLFVHEYRQIRVRFYRRSYSMVLLFLLCETFLYCLFCPQDPGQIYRFYSYDYGWYSGLGYLMFAPGLAVYVGIVLITILCTILAVISILKYTQDYLAASQEEVVMETKFDVARTGVAVFVHSTKNQLLSNRILEKRMYSELDSPAPDLEKIRKNLDALRDNNEMLLARSQELYNSAKENHVRLVPVFLSSVCEEATIRVYRKYPDALIDCAVDPSVEIMCDLNYLSEAFYNILINAWEAELAAGRETSPVLVRSHNTRHDVMLEITDSGVGIEKENLRKIFEPFYSSKNSTRNWGMGLNHVQVIIRAHGGSVRVESVLGKGTSFYIILPVYYRKHTENQAE